MSIVCQSCERETQREREKRCLSFLSSPLLSSLDPFSFVFLLVFYSVGLHFVVGYFSFV